MNGPQEALLAQLANGLIFSGNIGRDVMTFLKHHGCPKTADHSAQVAAEAKRLARRFGENEAQAEAAGWLHDASAIFPPADRVAVARTFKVPVLPEEKILPMIIHQKLSVVLARDIFEVGDQEVLSAIGCHTTLKANATPLDKVLFVADKIAWDQAGLPPYLADLLAGLEKSEKALDEATLVYIRYLRDRRQTLKVVHPWLREAYEQLSGARWA